MTKVNLFGDVRAEYDHDMLEKSFHESQSYRILFESQDRFVVVGRRGTGKSALVYRLSKDLKAQNNTIIVIAPTEEQVIGIRRLAKLFGESINKIRAGIKIIWKYALLLEIALYCKQNYKTANKIHEYETLSNHLTKWSKCGDNLLTRLRSTLRKELNEINDPDDRIAELPILLNINQISIEVKLLIESLNHGIVILIDRLDEGYEPDTAGIGIVDGIIYGTDAIRHEFADKVKILVFLRDNIFRAIQSEDIDFSRNLEGQILRLHWDSDELFYMVCKRIRTAFQNRTYESDLKTWNAVTGSELHGRLGFKKCLRLTLYRPRDVIALLNSAIEQAGRHNREIMTEDDFQASSKQISIIRFNDLGKEYESVFPGINKLTTAFSNGPAQFSIANACKTIKEVFNNPDLDAATLQHIRILGSEENIIKALYGVGFFGIFDQQNNTWVFSHDGKQPDRTVLEEDNVMIHPCYWSALNLQKDAFEQDDAEQIFDEYEITIDSLSTQERHKRLGQIIAELSKISTGIDDAHSFEDWCKRVLEIAFAKALTNIQLHPNKNATQRRDIVATNQGIRGFWKRILTDYETRQVIFEIKNYEKIGVDEYRQLSGYLLKEYGKLGFIICRDNQQGLLKGGDLNAFIEFYNQGKVILKITPSTLTSILSKLRNPSKIDAGDIALDKLLDTHIRLYSTGQSDKTRAKRAKKKQ